jgi:hypothetical protein
MYAHDAVIDFAAAAQPLPPSANRVRAAFGGARFIDAANGLGMSVLACHEPLTAVAQRRAIPLD